MKQHQFEAKHQAVWQRFEHLLTSNSKSKRQRKKISNHNNNEGNSDQKRSEDSDGFENRHDLNSRALNSRALNSEEAASTTATTSTHAIHLHTSSGYEFVRLYRVTCQHYALARQRHYSPQLVHYLQDLVIKGHQQLYRHQSHVWSKIYQFFRYTFPIRLRRHAPLFWLSLACFLVPALIMGWACYEHSDMLYSIMPESQVRMMEEMYNPANDMVGRDSSRRSDTDIMMFGHYISNNIGIDFRIYGMGIFAGVGTLLSLLYNGLVIGGVSGHLTGIGYGSTFWPFVSGHGSFELVAAVISGAAGLRLAQSLFMPGNYSRLDAFKIAGKQSIELLIGAATMTFIAAFIEAFWSSSSVIPDVVKYAVAIVLWGFVIGYLAFAGRKLERDIISSSQVDYAAAAQRSATPSQVTSS